MKKKHKVGDLVKIKKINSMFFSLSSEYHDKFGIIISVNKKKWEHFLKYDCLVFFPKLNEKTWLFAKEFDKVL